MASDAESVAPKLTTPSSFAFYSSFPVPLALAIANIHSILSSRESAHKTQVISSARTLKQKPSAKLPTSSSPPE